MGDPPPYSHEQPLLQFEARRTFIAGDWFRIDRLRILRVRERQDLLASGTRAISFQFAITDAWCAKKHKERDQG